MSDRHEKWQRVEPGTVIPAGQPYRWEYPSDGTAYERTPDAGRTVPDHDNTVIYFVDSSWHPPLVLPTEPTWGFAVRAGAYEFMRWWRKGNAFNGVRGVVVAEYRVDDVIDFIPLTEEQVQRIEAAR